jgi:hypothetical protein
MEQNTQEYPKPRLSGIVYGECAYWLAIAGMIIAAIGLVMYMFKVNQFFDAQQLMAALWEGKDTDTIWKLATGDNVQYGHWYLKNLGYSDGLAMLGIGVCCVAGVVGIWGSVIAMIVKKEKPYIFLVFALIIAIILIASAAGLISIH